MARVRPSRRVRAGFLSPAVRRVVAEHGLDVRDLVGSGLGGRITREDALVRARATAERETTVPFSPLRSRAAANLLRSKATAAHAWVAVAADYSSVERVRHEVGLTALPFVGRAVVDAIRAFPLVNARLEDDELTVAGSVRLGIAVDLDHEGLVVPVIPRAEDLRLRALARSIADVASRARARQLTPDDVSRGTFTITNPGSHGTFLSVPVINVPQVAILSTDGVSRRAVADGGSGIAVRPVGHLCLSFDARAIDAPYAAGFVARIAQILATRAWTSEL